jgi:hypothetical protein
MREKKKERKREGGKEGKMGGRNRRKGTRDRAQWYNTCLAGSRSWIQSQ